MNVDLSGLYVNDKPWRYSGRLNDLIVQHRPNMKPGSPDLYILHVDKATEKRTYLSGLFKNPDGSFRFDVGKGSSRLRYGLKFYPDGSLLVKLI